MNHHCFALNLSRTQLRWSKLHGPLKHSLEFDLTLVGKSRKLQRFSHIFNECWLFMENMCTVVANFLRSSNNEKKETSKASFFCEQNIPMSTGNVAKRSPIWPPRPCFKDCSSKTASLTPLGDFSEAYFEHLFWHYIFANWNILSFHEKARAVTSLADVN